MSTKSPPAMGSLEWLEHVYSQPPARSLKGHSKHSQYHAIPTSLDGLTVGGQGRTEACAVLLLDYLANAGYIAHFKQQPFRTTLDEFGYQIIPDYLVSCSNGNIFVIEVKTSRYITALVQATLDRNKEKFASVGIKYLCWTDKHPLSYNLRHNLMEMRRASRCVPLDEIEVLSAHLHDNRRCTFAGLVDEGFDKSVVFAAAWKSKAFFDFGAIFEPTTIVSLLPQCDLASIALSSSPSGHSWWDQLARSR